jgi:hypothetical protein
MLTYRYSRSSKACSMPFREGWSGLSPTFRAWRLCIEQSRNIRASALISTATAASHSTSKGYSVTILSSMGKAAPQIDGIGRRICSRRSRKTLCPLMILSRASSSVNHSARSTSGTRMSRPPFGGHSISQDTLSIRVASRSPAMANAVTLLPPA